MRVHLAALNAVEEQYGKSDDLQRDATTGWEFTSRAEACHAAGVPNRREHNILTGVRQTTRSAVNTDIDPAICGRIPHQITNALLGWAHHIARFDRVQIAATQVCIAASGNIGSVV